MTEFTHLIQQRVTLVKTVLSVDVCSFYLADTQRQCVKMLASCGLEKAIGTTLGYHQGLTGKVARTARPVAARDIQTHTEYFHIDGSGEERYTSYLGIPLERCGELLGVLVIQTVDSRTFFHRDIRELFSAGRDLMDCLTEEAHQKLAS
jgi:phosphotransferase system enzyme I (PtsP)